jgi:hypothetical protein
MIMNAEQVTIWKEADTLPEFFWEEKLQKQLTIPITKP